MLMDAFLAHTDCRRRRRYHFHEFMADVHRRLHARKLHYDQEKARARKKEEAAAAVRHHPMEDNDDDNHADLSPAAAAAAAAKINGSPPPSSRQDYVNPVTAVALEMAAEMSLLCLDEFQVLDVADAAILSQLFAILFRVGTVLVTTSNRPVTEIYRDGLHQQQQQQDTHGTPLIRSLQRHCILHPIQSDTDYRLLLSPSKIPSSTTTTTTTSTVAGTSNSRVIDAVDKGGVTSMFFVHAADDDENDGDELAPKSPPFEGLALRALTNQVFGDGPSATAVVVVTELPDVVMDTGFQRTLRVRTRRVQKVGGSGRGSNSAFTLACCTFDELCSGHFVSLCATDYRALARAPQVWDAIVVENIPVLSDSSTERGTGHNQARRFITLIDELYEAKVPLLCSAMAPPSQLFVCTTANRSTTTVGRGKNENDLEDDDSEIFGIDQAVDSQRHAVSALASVKELPFAFRRAASRLVEMTSLKWWKPVLDKIRDEPRNLSGE